MEGIIIENEIEFIDFIKKKQSNTKMKLQISHALNIKENKCHEIYYLKIEIALLKYTYIATDLHNIILDYCTIDYIHKCVLKKRDIGTLLNIYYPNGKQKCIIYKRHFDMRILLVNDDEEQRDELRRIRNVINTMYMK